MNIRLMLNVSKVYWRILFGSPSSAVRALISLRYFAQNDENLKLLRWCATKLQAYGMYIAPGAKISRSVEFPHPIGIVIGEGVTVEKDVKIFQNVTLGGARKGDSVRGQHPKIGRGTTIYAGVVVLGKVSIGAHCVIGANSVVLSDMPDNTVAVGAPARIIRSNLKEHQRYAEDSV